MVVSSKAEHEEAIKRIMTPPRPIVNKTQKRLRWWSEDEVKLLRALYQKENTQSMSLHRMIVFPLRLERLVPSCLLHIARSSLLTAEKCCTLSGVREITKQSQTTIAAGSSTSNPRKNIGPKTAYLSQERCFARPPKKILIFCLDEMTTSVI